MIASGEGGIKILPGPGQCRARIDITGGAEFCGNARQRHHFGKQLAIAVAERVHGCYGAVAGVVGGSTTGADFVDAGLSWGKLSFGKYNGPL
jgi:hypothetical protein